MLSVEAPAKFVLTLQSVPPFLLESILALALVVLLAVPLIAHIQLLLDGNAKSAATVAPARRKYDSDERRGESPARTIVMHYPVPYKLQKSSNSDLNVELTSMRTTFSSPELKKSDVDIRARISDENPHFHEDGAEKQAALREIVMTKQKRCLPLERSSPFVPTNAQLPIIDISAYDYDSYRHKLIESSLRRQYGDRQAPGNVVLNSIHLNSIGSQTGIELSERYSHSLFDFIEEYYDATSPMSKKEREYLHPLDHFLVKGSARPRTADRSTETKESNTELDQVPEMIDFREQSPISSGPLSASPDRRRINDDASKNPSRMTIRSRRSSSLPRNSSRITARNSIPTATSPTKAPGGLSLDKIVDRRPSVASTLRTSRSRTPRGFDAKVPPRVRDVPRKRASSLIPAKSSVESLTGGTSGPSEYTEARSTDRDDRESVTCASASSSDAGSSGSSTRHRERRPVRSRGSSLSTRTRGLPNTPSQGRQWYVGVNPNPSFNRNYPDVRQEQTARLPKPKFSPRPRSTGDRFAWDVPDVPGSSGTWHDKIDDKRSSRLLIAERSRTLGSSYGAGSRRRTPEKAKISDTVLPVLESVVDLAVVTPNYPNDSASKDEMVRDTARLLDTGRGSKRREMKMATRTRDKKLSSASFVKNPAVERLANVPVTVNPLDRVSSIKEPFPETRALAESSSRIKRSANRPGSASRLPVHVGCDRTLIKKLSQDTNRPQMIDSHGKSFDEPADEPEKSSADISVRTRRPRTAGCLQSRVSSAGPKIESLVDGKSSGVRDKAESGITIQKGSFKGLLGQDQTRIPSRSASNAGKKGPPVSRGSIAKIEKFPDHKSSILDNEASRNDPAKDGSPKKAFLRARSGRHGAPKLRATEKEPGIPIVDSTGSGRAMVNCERELLKLPSEGSKAALVMRRELKTYIKKIKIILSNRDKSIQAKDLAALSITEAVIPELRALLSSREIDELQAVLNRMEKQEGSHLALGALTRL